MHALLPCFLVVALLAASAPVQADIVGVGRALDGDTLDIGGVRLRLFGIDAPETGQPCADASGAAWDCGGAAATRLAALIAAEDLRCVAVDRDRYGRIVARCAAGEGDVAARLVTEGLAWAYTQYSVEYVGAEALARAAARGVWQGDAEVAWDWRQSEAFRPAAGGDPAGGAPTSACPIKGNISTKGERIYHLPASRAYDRTRIAEAYGERWFCTEAEAVAAGWRPVAGRRAGPTP